MQTMMVSTPLLVHEGVTFFPELSAALLNHCRRLVGEGSEGASPTKPLVVEGERGEDVFRAKRDRYDKRKSATKPQHAHWWSCADSRIAAMSPAHATLEFLQHNSSGLRREYPPGGGGARDLAR